MSEELREKIREQIDALPEDALKNRTLVVEVLVAALAEKPAERPAAQKILESLTPGGSEFAGDPDACAAYVHKKISTLQDIAKSAVKARMAAQAERPQLSAAKLIQDSTWRDGWRWCCPHGNESAISASGKMGCGCCLMIGNRALLTGEAEKVPPTCTYGCVHGDYEETCPVHGNAPAAPPALQAEPPLKEGDEVWVRGEVNVLEDDDEWIEVSFETATGFHELSFKAEAIRALRNKGEVMSTKVVNLQSGGTIVLALNGNLFTFTDSDRALYSELTDACIKFELATKRPESKPERALADSPVSGEAKEKADDI